MAKNGVLIRRLDRQNLFNLLQEEIVPRRRTRPKNTSPLQKLLRKGRRTEPWQIRINPACRGKGAAPKGPRTIWDNPIFTMVLAIILGFVTWTIVTVFIDPRAAKS